MSWSIVAAVASQMLFTLGDVVARPNMQRFGFGLATFLKAWFPIYFGVRIIATFLQLYVYSTTPLGRASLLFAVLAPIITVLAAWRFLGEQPTGRMLIGALFALPAIYFLSSK